MALCHSVNNRRQRYFIEVGLNSYCSKFPQHVHKNNELRLWLHSGENHTASSSNNQEQSPKRQHRDELKETGTVFSREHTSTVKSHWSCQTLSPISPNISYPTLRSCTSLLSPPPSCLSPTPCHPLSPPPTLLSTHRSLSSSLLGYDIGAVLQPHTP